MAFFIPAIAFAGLSPLGQEVEQFIIEWHLYNLKDSSNLSNRFL